MADRAITLSAPAVLALFAGRKSQHRLPIKLPTKGEYINPRLGGWEPTTVGGGCFSIGRDGSRVPTPEMAAIWNQTTGTCIVPHKVEDRLWVRETWRLPDDHDADSPAAFLGGLSDLAPGPNGLVRFEADGRDAWGDPYGFLPPGRLRAAMHPPRRLSRLTLIVTDVRVQRLQDISEPDIVAEGVDPLESDLVAFHEEFCGGHCIASKEQRSRKRAFTAIWNAQHGVGAYERDGWVAALTFTVHHANIDALPAPAPEMVAANA